MSCLFSMNNGLKKLLMFLTVLLPVITAICSFAQKPLIAQNPYSLVVHYKDSVINPDAPVIKTSFTDLKQVSDYINNLPQWLAAKGYPVASVDSVRQEKNTFHIVLYLGTKYSW